MSWEKKKNWKGRKYRKFEGFLAHFGGSVCTVYSLFNFKHFTSSVTDHFCIPYLFFYDPNLSTDRLRRLEPSLPLRPFSDLDQVTPISLSTRCAKGFGRRCRSRRHWLHLAVPRRCLQQRRTRSLPPPVLPTGAGGAGRGVSGIIVLYF